MKFMVCPQCGTAVFYVTNKAGERLNVKVNRELEIIPTDETKQLDGFDLNVLYCLGCSWSGSVYQLKKYLV